MLRSRLIEVLNVPHTGKELFRQLEVGRVRMLASGFDSPPASLDELFEHPALMLSSCPKLTGHLSPRVEHSFA